MTRSLFASVALLVGCGGGSSYVWVNDLPRDQRANDYAIASGDTVSVRVFNQDNLSTRAHVRSDGKIAVPIVGDVIVRGKSPTDVSKDLEGRLKAYVVTPIVMTTIEESQPTSVSVLGEVQHPGNYAVDTSSGVLTALAAAGGFTQFASHDSIYLVRRDPAQRIRFTFATLTDANSPAADFRLHRGDVIVVE